MFRMTSRLAGAVLTAISIGALPTGSALAQSNNVSCPCLDAAEIDAWFTALELSPDRDKEMFMCVDEPGFLTFDYFDRTAEKRAIYVDLTYARSRTEARCTFEVSDSETTHENFQTEMLQSEINRCRAEVLSSRIWRDLKCPASKRVLDK